MPKTKPSKMRACGARLRKTRKSQGLKQTAMAELVGIRQGHLSMIEAGKRRPSVEALERLAGQLGVSVDFLLKGQP